MNMQELARGRNLDQTALMPDEFPTNQPAIGLRRFHKLTIGAAVVFLALLALRYLRLYLRVEEGGRYLAFALLSLVAALVLARYLWGFARSGALD
ncbi:MAG: hypothetical protein H6807_03615 [Planctomycetes bacterium]|nr:hypothetical protein [Planctomycetota bacterium]